MGTLIVYTIQNTIAVKYSAHQQIHVYIGLNALISWAIHFYGCMLHLYINSIYYTGQ